MGRKYIWADLIALGTNGWNDQPHEESQSYGQGVADFLRCEDKVWRTLTENARDVGMNMVVIDLMEGLGEAMLLDMFKVNAQLLIIEQQKMFIMVL